MRIRGLLLRRFYLFVLFILLVLIYFNVGGLSCYFCAWTEQSTSRSIQEAMEAPMDKTPMVVEIEEPWSAPTSPSKSSKFPDGVTQASPANKFQPEWWRNHTETACRALGMSTNHSLVHRRVFERVLVDDKHKLLFCRVAQVASTNLGRIFAILAGLFNGTDPNLVPRSEMHTTYNRLHVHLHSLPVGEIARKLRHYYKFTFVREPYERLLSAYRNKFIKPYIDLYLELSNEIIRVYRTNSSLTGGMTFEEFIRYVADPQRKVPTNNHWQPFYELCRPCEVKYDFVGKLPTFNEDTRHVLEVNHLTSIVDFPKMPDTLHSLHKTDLLLEKYYSTIPKELLKQLFKIYSPDYAIFDLEVPSVIKKMMT